MGKCYHYIAATILLAFGALQGNLAFAKDFEYKEQKSFSKDAEQIKQVLLDFESFCEQSCFYFLSNVEKMRVLEKNLVGPKDGEGTYYVWSQISSGIQRYAYIAEVVVRYDEALKSWNFTSSYPSKEKIRQLKATHAVEHNPFFYNQKVIWNVTTTDEWNTQVSYHYFSQADSILARTFSSQINQGIKQSAKDHFDIFSN